MKEKQFSKSDIWSKIPLINQLDIISCKLFADILQIFCSFEISLWTAWENQLKSKKSSHTF